MAKKRSFDTAILNDIKSVAGDSFADNIKMLPIEQLHENKDNFYDVSDLDALIEDIDRQGLKTPLYVVPNDNDEYTIISGHRRRAAVQELINSGKYGTDKLPCYIGGRKSEAETMLDLIMLNATARVISDAETVKQCEKLEEIFRMLEADGKKFQGRMRDKIAAVLNVSPAQVGKVENIRHNAIDEVKTAVDNGQMSISTANEIAKLEPEKQKDLIEKKNPEKITHKEVKESQRADNKKTIADNSSDVLHISTDKSHEDFDETEGVESDNVSEKNEKAFLEPDADSQSDVLHISTDKSHEDFDETEDIESNNISEKNEKAFSEPDADSSSDVLHISADESHEDFDEIEDIENDFEQNMLQKPEGYFNKIVDSGMCDAIIMGYALLALDTVFEDIEENGIENSANVLSTVRKVMDLNNAKKARDRYYHRYD